ncbi:MAG: hypothetical protein ACI8PG_004987 [Planctomycetota bacterium]|jgi:hypothetical protein
MALRAKDPSNELLLLHISSAHDGDLVLLQ